MDFRTQIQLSKQKKTIDYKSSIMLFGSCFAEHLGQKLDYFKFHNNVNPFGILFNPKAIETAVSQIVNKETYTPEQLLFHNERYHSFHHHSEFSAAKPEEVVSNINNSINQAHLDLIEASHVIITLGTSWVYRFIETDQIVANCHKIPQKKFLKELLSVDEITAQLESIVTLITHLNPKATILFTVSPVRHLRDGMVENTLSKAHLISAVHQIIDNHSYFYFPSYEMLMDDLRDYRFYSNDMLHPNQTAVDYVWEQFKTTWINDSEFELMKEVDTVQKSLAHKPFNPDSENHQKFLENLQIKIQKLDKNQNIRF